MDQTSIYSQSTLSFLNTQIAHRSPLSQQERCFLEQLYNLRKAKCDIMSQGKGCDV